MTAVSATAVTVGKSSKKELETLMMEEIFETPDSPECEKSPGEIKPSSSDGRLASSVGCCNSMLCVVEGLYEVVVRVTWFFFWLSLWRCNRHPLYKELPG